MLNVFQLCLVDACVACSESEQMSPATSSWARMLVLHALSCHVSDSLDSLFATLVVVCEPLPTKTNKS